MPLTLGFVRDKLEEFASTTSICGDQAARL